MYSGLYQNRICFFHYKLSKSGRIISHLKIKVPKSQPIMSSQSILRAETSALVLYPLCCDEQLWQSHQAPETGTWR